MLRQEYTKDLKKDCQNYKITVYNCVEMYVICFYYTFIYETEYFDRTLNEGMLLFRGFHLGFLTSGCFVCVI